MDAQAILEIKPALTAYLHEFDGCFANVRSQRHWRPMSPGSSAIFIVRVSSRWRMLRGFLRERCRSF